MSVSLGTVGRAVFFELSREAQMSQTTDEEELKRRGVFPRDGEHVGSLAPELKGWS